jgi:ubiquitin-protein ligase
MPQYQVYFDTLEGEKRYDVDIGEDEPIEIVLRDVLGELAERGHMMRGLSTGDLKVIFGGREGRELDLARTLPEQGVRPNDVLRVLIETYEGGGATLRRDRIEKEWTLLGRLAERNPDYVEVLGRAPSAVEEIFHVELRHSPGVSQVDGRMMRRRDTHTLRLVFPRFYPEVPLECYVAEPLFHPNVKPETGFVCLWQQTSSMDTVIQAIARAQAIAAYRMVNMGSVHQMNPAAAAWYSGEAQPHALVPLTWNEIQVFDTRDGRFRFLEPGRQLAASSRARLL